MNSMLAVKEELQDTSSIELATVPKHRMSHTPLILFLDAVTTLGTVFTTGPDVYSFTTDLGAYFTSFVTTPQTDLTFVETQGVKRFSVARPVVSPVEFESNPIVRVYPATGKHYPMRVVRRSTASFKPIPIKVFGKNTESSD